MSIFSDIPKVDCILTMIFITEANQSFSKVERLVDEHGMALILKNNIPRYDMIPQGNRFFYLICLL